jgi:hypothetical protein
MICLFHIHLFKGNIMSLDQSTPHTIPASTTPQQHHAQAAEHLEIAVKSHKEAAKLLGANDQKGAEAQAKIAHDHTAQAKEHMAEAAKKPLVAAK